MYPKVTLFDNTSKLPLNFDLFTRCHLSKFPKLRFLPLAEKGALADDRCSPPIADDRSAPPDADDRPAPEPTTDDRRSTDRWQTPSTRDHRRRPETDDRREPRPSTRAEVGRDPRSWSPISRFARRDPRWWSPPHARSSELAALQSCSPELAGGRSIAGAPIISKLIFFFDKEFVFN